MPDFLKLLSITGLTEKSSSKQSGEGNCISNIEALASHKEAFRPPRGQPRCQAPI